VQPTDGRNITGDFNPAIHGFDGMTRTSLPNQLQRPLAERFFSAAVELGGNFEVNLDMNSGRPLGASKCFERLRSCVLAKSHVRSMDTSYDRWWREE
jgi:choline dehydrogenase